MATGSAGRPYITAHRGAFLLFGAESLPNRVDFPTAGDGGLQQQHACLNPRRTCRPDSAALANLWWLTEPGCMKTGSESSRVTKWPFFTYSRAGFCTAWGLRMGSVTPRPLCGQVDRAHHHRTPTEAPPPTCIVAIYLPSRPGCWKKTVLVTRTNHVHSCMPRRSIETIGQHTRARHKPERAPKNEH